MALSAIYLLNWFYSFSLNRLSLICFCNWKKKKKILVWKIRVNPTRPNPTHNPIDLFKNDWFWSVTRLTRKPDWPDPTCPARFATSAQIRTQLWNWTSFVHCSGKPQGRPSMPKSLWLWARLLFVLNWSNVDNLDPKI